MYASVTNFRRISFAAFALLVVFGIPTVASSAAHAAEDDVTWTVRTASNDFGAERSSYRYTVNPGSTVEDALVVVNHGDTALDLGVYAADGYTTDSGQFDLVVGGAKSVAVGTWVRSSVDRISVGPGETIEVPFAVTVPRDAMPGDYGGGIVTSLVQTDAIEGINVDRRLGIRIALRVSGDLAPSLAVENMQVTWDGGLNPFAGGDATVSYTIHNTGNTMLSAQQTADVAGPFGWLPTGTATIAAIPQLLPNETWEVTASLRDVPAMFLLTATATVTPVVTDASGSTTALAPIVASANGWAAPWGLLLLIAAVAALVIVGLRLQKRHRMLQQEREAARVKEAVELALTQAKEPAPAG